MKPFRILAFALALLWTACDNPTKYAADDFSVPLCTPTYAAGFDIRGKEDDPATLITIRNPWQGAEQVEQHFLVLRGDTQAPDNFGGTIVRAPIQRVVCLSSSHVAMFDALGEVRRIRGVSGLDYISNPYIREHSLCGEVRDVGYDAHLDFELLAALRPDLVLLYGVTGENTATTGKLRELRIPYLYIGDYLEPSPLGKAEWLMVVAELCDCRERGAALFDEIAARYNATAERVQTSFDQHGSTDDRRPKVLLNTPYRDTWFLPPRGSYMVRLIHDAGGDAYTLSDEGNTSLPIDMEQAYLLAADADVWLNVGACNTLDELRGQNPKFADLSVVRNHRVYNNNRRHTPGGGSDFWESGTVHPDAVLRDLAAILHPAFDIDTLTYYKRLE